MRFSRALFGVAVAGLAAASFVAARDLRKEGLPRDDLRSMVARLGSPSRSERQAAEQSLAGRGPEILAELSRLAPLCSGESRLRLDRVVARLEAVLVERATEPAIVSLDAEGEPARELLARIARETGNVIAVSDEVATGAAGRRPVTLSLDRATYWEAIDELLSKAALEIDCLDDGRRFVIVPAVAAARRRVAAGPLLVVADGVEFGRPAADGRAVRVGLRILWEPRLVPLVIRLPMESVQVEGPQGESVPPSSRRAVLEATVLPGATWLPVTLPLVAKNPVPAAIDSVRATLQVWSAGGEHDFELPLGRLPATATQRVGQATVFFHADRRGAGRLAVEAEVVYDAPSEPLASHRMWLVDRELELVSYGNAGTAVSTAAVTHRVVRRDDRGLAVEDEFRFEVPAAGLPPANQRVRWRLPAAVRELPVDVILRGPMP